MDTKWHTLPIAEVLKILESGEQGLSDEEAKRRLERDGANKLPEAKVDGVFVIFLRQFQSPLIYILLAACVFVFAIGEPVDAGIILFVLVFNAIVGAIQEGKAQNTLLALKRFVETRGSVVRGGREIIIPDGEVVAGDIIVLNEGEKIPADARIISAHNLKIDEAALTGESGAVHKLSEEMKNAEAPVLEQKNMLFKGTHVVAGHGRAVVTASGANTVIGKIAHDIAAVDTEIPLKANIRHLSRLIIMVVAAASTFIFITGLASGKGLLEMLITVISITVSVIPEGLPIAVTLILATGVWRMSKRNALVKRLQAVEALGQARVIAVDKTGTLTKNEMTIEKVYVNGQVFEISGVGYEPRGDVKLDGKNVSAVSHPELMYAGRIAAYCASARTIFDEESKSWRVSGDPTEAAMFVLAEKLGFKKDELERETPMLEEIPFDYKLKYHTTVHKDKRGKIMTVVGAPEAVLAMCKRMIKGGKTKAMSRSDLAELEEAVENLSSEGLRVIAFATSSGVPDELTPENIHSLTFIGFFGMKDALREEVKDASRRAQDAGIRVVMITGDHRTTATAIAREALIYKDGDSVLTGAEVETMSDNSLKDHLGNVTVFARVTPEHKQRIINAYKARGEIIAMTGDGVNDAPSLVAADLGVGMGRIGTEVAKEASDIVLLDDNFGSIVSAIEEGRSIYKTIKKVVLYLLSTSIGELLVITGAILLGFPLPLLPAQIIWLNFITDGFFTVALAMEPREKGLLSDKFEKPNKYLVNALMAQRMLLMALPMMIFTLVLFSGYFAADIAKGWTISLTLLAVFQWFNAWNCRSEKESIFRTNPFENRFMVAATVAAITFQLLAVYHPLFQKFLRTVPLDLSEWALIIVLASSILLVEETRKFISWKSKKSWSSSDQQLQASRS